MQKESPSYMYIYNLYQEKKMRFREIKLHAIKKFI